MKDKAYFSAVKKRVNIIGGGTAGLLFASFLDSNQFEVHIYEKNKTLGRKFLVAGDGGFNLTHGENIEQLVNRYFPVDFLSNALHCFSNENFMSWLKELDIPTFVGSSNRVYPLRGIKPIAVLNKIVAHLKQKGCVFHYNHEFLGWDQQNNLLFKDKSPLTGAYNVFALGGGSWKITGSCGNWSKAFELKGINTLALQAENCAFQVEWQQEFVNKYEGTPLKNTVVKFNKQSQKGELVITKFGLEGNAIYALSHLLQKEINANGFATIYLDLKPTLNGPTIEEKLNTTRLKRTQCLKKELKIPASMLSYIKSFLSKEEFMGDASLSKFIKNVPIIVLAAAPIDQAISTSGGIPLSSLTPTFELKTLPNHYCIGEMVNWTAPTGGYLIQGCSSMGVYLAKKLNE